MATLAFWWNCGFQWSVNAIGQKESDLPNQLWLLWWENHPQQDSLVLYPDGIVNFYSMTPIHHFIGRLLYPNIVLAHNLATWLAVLLCIVGGGVLGRRVGRHWSATVAGALMLLTSVPMISALKYGYGEFLWLGMLAIWLVSLDDVLRSQRWLALIRSTVLLSLNIVLCWYYGAAALLLVLLLFAFQKHRIIRQHLMLMTTGAIALSALFINRFVGSALDDRMVASGFWEQIFQGSEMVSDAHLSNIPWMIRWQLSEVGAWWSNLWLIFLVSALFVGRKYFLDDCALNQTSSKVRHWHHPLILISCTLAAFLLGAGSYTPHQSPLPMLWINRFLEWFGLGMHSPYHLSTIGVLCLTVLAIKYIAHKPVLVFLLPFHFIQVMQIPSWKLPIGQLPQVSAPLIHISELEQDISKRSSQDFQYLALLQLQHQQPIPSFPLFPMGKDLHSSLLLPKTLENFAQLRLELLEQGFGFLAFDGAIHPLELQIRNWKMRECCQENSFEQTRIYQLLPH